ncbi:hypothetical protein FKM82_028049 [Ascaphus truei]
MSLQFGDWIMPSDTLYLRKVNLEQAGRYTCQARHPEDYDLVKTKSFSLRVIPKHTEYLYAGAGVEDFLLYIAAPAVMLLLLVITLLVLCIRHRNRQMRKPHISWVNTEKRSPIYKGSAESVCATTSDTQPLFM